VKRACLAVLLLVFFAPGCGDGPDVGDELRERTEKLSDQARDARQRTQKAGARLVRRVRAALERIRRSVPQATRDEQAPSSQGRTKEGKVDGYLTDVLESVDSYWTRTLRANGLPEPRVSYLWIPPGRAARTGCGLPADDNAAFYCPSDDTIYVAERLAADIWSGASDDFPGQRAGYGRAVGDFGLAYVVAHEYAHNVQQELGLTRTNPRFGVEPVELQADCMAGLWGNSVYREGRLNPGDVEEAISTVQAAGDFASDSPQHHGTPEQRRAAWLLGYRSGDPQRCQNAAGV
jgi:predicted metalloprotease